MHKMADFLKNCMKVERDAEKQNLVHSRLFITRLRKKFLGIKRLRVRGRRPTV